MEIEYIKLQMNEEMKPRYLVVENHYVKRVFINGMWDDSPLRLEEYQHLYELRCGERIDARQLQMDVSKIYKE